MRDPDAIEIGCLFRKAKEAMGESVTDTRYFAEEISASSNADWRHGLTHNERLSITGLFAPHFETAPRSRAAPWRPIEVTVSVRRSSRV
jgi:hypothetical protein